MTQYYHCMCGWRGPLAQAVHNRGAGDACPRCRGSLYPLTDPFVASTPASDALDALYQLLAACCVGHIRWPEGTRGEREARHALKQARHVLLKSSYRVQAAELGEPAPAGKEPANGE